MKKFKILLSIILIIFLAIASGFILVFTNFWNPKDEISSFSKNIFINDENLSKNILTIKSNDFPSLYKISWDCDATGKYLKSENKKHFFEVSFSDKNCDKKEISIKIKNFYKTLNYKFSLFKEFDLLNKFSDYPYEELEKLDISVKKEISNSKNLNFLSFEKIRETQELAYFEKIFAQIKKSKKSKFSTPIKWYPKITRETKVPNSPRPYRESYTIWIHQWWDFDAKKWTPVYAIDDWIIIKVVNNFSENDFLKIKKDNPSFEDKLKNLDILRGNQVWQKTLKWDIVFYSHFDEIPNNLKVWDIIKRWEKVGIIWASWVPEEWYSDFHLHIEVRKNPFNIKKAWNYSEMDFMSWDWYFKWETPAYVIEHQNEIFDFKN